MKILSAEAKDVTILPTEAVNIGKDGTFCWVCKDGILVKRSISTGVTSDDCAEITEGLEPGEQVIPDPGSHEEGDSIRIKEASISVEDGEEGQEETGAEAKEGETEQKEAEGMGLLMP